MRGAESLERKDASLTPFKEHAQLWRMPCLEERAKSFEEL